MPNLDQIISNALEKDTNERKAQDEYWENWLTTQKSKLDAMEEIDPLQKSFIDIMELAISLKQYERPEDENTEVSRLIRFSIDLARDIIEEIFAIKTYSFYGSGLYTIMDGLLITRETRERMGFDTKGAGKFYNLKMFSDEQLKTYNFGLAIPAMGGLFIPKRTRLLTWIERNWQLQYFDIVDINKKKK